MLGSQLTLPNLLHTQKKGALDPPPTPLGDAPGPCWPLAPGSSTQARVLARV